MRARAYRIDNRDFDCSHDSLEYMSPRTRVAPRFIDLCHPAFEANNLVCQLK
jgi:hypothetical protein